MIIERLRVYRAKKPRATGADWQYPDGFVNDRVVLYVNRIGDIVQYDGPAVANGRHYPKCTLKAFEEWAGEDVTDKMPEGEWQRWLVPKAQPASINPGAAVADAINPKVPA